MMPSSLSPVAAASARSGSGSYYYAHHLPFFVSYLLFGLIHELSHVAIASVLLKLHQNPFQSLEGLVRFAIRALLGRYCIVEIDDEDAASDGARLAIRHLGWIFSLALAVGLHYWHVRCSSIGESAQKRRSFWLVEPIVIVSAYVTALEAMTTDLFRFVPVFHQVGIMYCVSIDLYTLDSHVFHSSQPYYLKDYEK